MGGRFSNLKKKDGNDEYAERMRQYENERKLETDQDRIIEDPDDLGKTKLNLWQKLLYGKPARITYAITLGLVVGIITSLIIFMVLLDVEERTIYGSCLINENARFECLVNSAEVTDENSCVKAMCCWENKNILPFKCYHSFPTAYQYKVSTVKKSNASGMEWTEIETTSNHDNSPTVQTHVHWESEGHLVVELFNPEKFPNRKISAKSTKSNKFIFTNNQKQAATQLPFQLGQLEKGSYFHIELKRNETGETIFDTRLGPLMMGDDHITIATLLPTEKFYGLKGGQKTDSTLTYGLVSGFENSELPYYMSLEKSGAWHGVLIETSNPMLIQVVQAPGIMFHSETDAPEINFHFFNGPTQAEVLQNLHTYIRKNHNVAGLRPIPPYWALGIHLCRRVVNETMLRNDLKSLADEYIPYDSDCVDEYLRHPFDVDAKRFENISEILDTLNSTKRIFLSQKITAPSMDSSSSNIWILRSTTTYPFIGEVDNMTVKYFDFFNPVLKKFPEIPGNLTYYGISLDNFPKLYNSSTMCNPSTRIQSLFSSPQSSTNGLNTSYLWGSVCHDTRHNTGPGQYARHKSLHNLYGQKSLKTVHQELTLGDSKVISSTSIWTGSFYYGFFNGMEVPFSWKGLQESVAHTIRNYALAPVAGTPICGSMIFNMTTRHDNELCLRWFQFALLLPFVRNSYDGVSSFGPLHFSDNYKRYLNESIEARYIYAPYYYTLLYAYQNNEPPIPMVTPTSFYFDDATEREREFTFPLFDQFMIGKAILAAPIIESGAMRSVYFPPGDWYAMDGESVRTNSTHGGSQRIAGLITETPMFLQAGCIVPTLLYETPSLLIEDSLKNNYSLIVGLAVTSDNPEHSGELIHPESLHKVQFFAHNTKSNGPLTISVSGPGSADRCGNSKFSTIIEQIRIFGLTTTGCKSLSIELSDHNNSTEIKCKYFPANGRLQIEGLHINWCKLNLYKLIISSTK